MAKRSGGSIAAGSLPSSLVSRCLKPRTAASGGSPATDPGPLRAAGLRSGVQCENEGINREQMYVERYADMRYQGQEHTIKIPLADGPLNAAALVEACESAEQRSSEHMLMIPEAGFGGR